MSSPSVRVLLSSLRTTSEPATASVNEPATAIPSAAAAKSLLLLELLRSLWSSRIGSDADGVGANVHAWTVGVVVSDSVPISWLGGSYVGNASAMSSSDIGEVAIPLARSLARAGSLETLQVPAIQVCTSLSAAWHRMTPAGGGRGSAGAILCTCTCNVHVGREIRRRI